MSDNSLKVILAIPAIITAAVGLAGLLGLAKYLIEPWYNARALRRKYATALWIACADLRIRLQRIHERIVAGHQQTVDALKKIPDNDSKRDGSVRPDSLAPLSFAEFCEQYTTDSRFRLFYEQVHMYIWFVADGRKPYLDSVNNVQGYPAGHQPGRDGAACAITSGGL